MSAARDVLRRLSALGARVECRGERVILRPGRRHVPPELIEAARQVKAELSKVLNAAKDAHCARGEHLRCAERENPRISAASVEDAQLSAFDEHLGADRPKMLTEYPHLSTFDKPEAFCANPSNAASKVLKESQLSVFGGAERVTHAPECRSRNIWKLHRVTVAILPPRASETTIRLIDAARQKGAVLVPDGMTLIVVEHEPLPVSILDALEANAGAIIAVLRQESRERSLGQAPEPPEAS